MNRDLYALLRERKDREALAILVENPDLADNTVVRLALDNRCFKTIAFLRERDLITLKGKKERERHRLKEYNENLKKLESIAEELESHFKNSPRGTE